MQGLSLSQFVPGESVLHRLDPRSKVVTVLLLSVAVFTARGPLELGSLSLLCLLLMMASGIRAAYYWRSLRPFLIMIIPTALLQVLLLPGSVCYHWGPLMVSEYGLIMAGAFSLRLIVLILFLRLLTLTTTPNAIIHGCEKMVSPLAKIGLPVSELLTIMNLTLAFVPFFLEEGQRVRLAQTSRGMSLREGSIRRRLESLLALLVPLWRGAFERSTQLAEAMEARGYSAGIRRTSLYQLHWGMMDSSLSLIGMAVLLLEIIH